MVKFKALYKAMSDDLKDAEMMIDYACEIREHEEDTALAGEFAKYAKYRLDHLMEFHKLFVAELAKTEKSEKDSKAVTDCLWKETHEMFQSWYKRISDKVAKY